MRKIVRGEDASLLHVQDQLKIGSLALRRIRLDAVVVEAQRSEVRQQGNEIDPAVFVAPPDVSLRNVVPSPGDSRPDARHVQFRAEEAHVPNVNRSALSGGLQEQP